MMECKKIFALVLTVIMLITVSVTVSAETTTQSIELTTRSVLLIDRSGSMDDQQSIEAVFSQYEQGNFDAIVEFDHRIAGIGEEFSGGGDSHICETIDDLIDSGFTHITIVTDGEQWPETYAELAIYTDVDIVIHLVEEDEASLKFINEFKDRLINSNLKVVKPDGTVEVILDDYKPPIYSIEIPVITEQPETEETITEKPEETIINEQESEDTVKNSKKGFPWLIVLILAMLVAALFDFIHELITRGREEDKTGESTSTSTTTKPKPMPAKAVTRIEEGAHVIADFSGSMAIQQAETERVCIEVGSEEVVTCFGDFIQEVDPNELSNMTAQGHTLGWEVLEYASSQGYEDIVLISDLRFNGKNFSKRDFPKKFKRITVVAPRCYDVETYSKLRRIADEVEVCRL